MIGSLLGLKNKVDDFNYHLSQQQYGLPLAPKKELAYKQNLACAFVLVVYKYFHITFYVTRKNAHPTFQFVLEMI